MEKCWRVSMKSTLPNAKKYPKFIRQNDVVKEFANQKRVWQQLGLKNCSKQLNKNSKIVFTGSGNRALWDIATMSMRGINSCQKWNSGYRRCLIGSMVDPYVGIIYITNGKRTKYGSNMIRRSVVRLVINTSTRKPAIMIERVYLPYDYYDYDGTTQNITTKNEFKKFIKERVGEKLPVIYAEDVSTFTCDYFIPTTKPVAKLTSPKRSYRDSRTPYRSVVKFNDISKIKP
jgi:hypothetical protein